MCSTGVITRATIWIGSAIGAAAPLMADQYGSWDGADHHLWGLTGMPDLDQVREDTVFVPGLPNEGRCYCLPTAAMNVMAYIARHGYPQIAPGVRNWADGQLQTYNIATENIELMGGVTLMDTDSGLPPPDMNPPCGTGGDENYNGHRQWLPEDQFVVYHQRALSNQPTTSRDIAKIGLAPWGNLMDICYGRWEHTGTDLTDRTGGHCVTPVQVKRVSSTYSIIKYRNPWATDSTTTQSAFESDKIQVQDDQFTYLGAPIQVAWMLPGSGDCRVDSSDGRFRLIDGIMVIQPKMGLTDWPAGSISGYVPNPVDPNTDPISTFPAPGGTVIACEAHPNSVYLAYVTVPGTGLGELSVLDTVTGQVATLPLRAPPTDVAYGRQGRIFVATQDSSGGTVIAYSQEDGAAGLTLGADVQMQLPAPHAADALAVDDATDEIVVLSVASASVLRMPRDLSVGPSVLSIPAGAAPVGRGHIAVDPADSSVWVGGDGGSSIVQLVHDVSGGLVAGMSVEAPTGSTLGGFSVGSAGHVFAVIDGHVTEWAPDGAGGMQEVAGSPFAGLSAGSGFRIMRSRDNADPVFHAAPGWDVNIDTAELAPATTSLPDCDADLDGSETVDVFDLLAYLAIWFDAAPSADMTFDTTVDVFDLLAYLQLWFAGC